MTLKFRKVGGLYHWRIGRLGGSFYVARKVSTTRNAWVVAAIEDRAFLACMSIAGLLVTYAAY